MCFKNFPPARQHSSTFTPIQELEVLSICLQDYIVVEVELRIWEPLGALCVSVCSKQALPLWTAQGEEETRKWVKHTSCCWDKQANFYKETQLGEEMKDNKSYYGAENQGWFSHIANTLGGPLIGRCSPRKLLMKSWHIIQHWCLWGSTILEGERSNNGRFSGRICMRDSLHRKDARLSFSDFLGSPSKN